jgi:DNA-directed RNA polymerase subunit beta'
LVVRRGEEARDDQLPHLPPRKGRPVLRAHLRSGADWECACGKYKGTKYKGIICDRCGVKVTHSRVRRKRMGHINLAAPVVHIWFFKAMPSRLGNLLGMKTSHLEKVIYFQDYVVIDPGDTPWRPSSC